MHNLPERLLQEEFHCKIITITSFALIGSQLALHFPGCSHKIENSKQWKNVSLHLAGVNGFRLLRENRPP